MPEFYANYQDTDLSHCSSVIQTQTTRKGNIPVSGFFCPFRYFPEEENQTRT